MVKKIFQKIISKPHQVFLFTIFALALIIYLPSLTTFYTNDDFFHLRISNVSSTKEFINFFNLSKAPEGWGLYRPLTTQVFYFLAWKVFSLNPLGLHIISFLVFFGVIYLIYLLTRNLFVNSESKFVNKVALSASLLYATSATHFGHLYFLGAFQELGVALFFFLSVIIFIKFLQKGKLIMYAASLIAFLLSLLCKETAVVLPLIFIPIYWFLRFQKHVSFSLNKFLISLVPYFFFLLLYFYFRVTHYGFAQGESYVWDFSISRAMNTLGWYGLWSFNLPETLVDFVGPGFLLNPNLFKYWSGQIIPIFLLFGVFFLEILFLILKNVKKLFLNHKSLILILFCTAWFITTLMPVLFLPLHKFTFYLTIPIFGVVVFISYLFINYESKIMNRGFIFVWIILSFLTLNLTRQTNWITRGAQTARNVHNYLRQNANSLEGIKTIAFYDTEEDSNLPWSPSEILKATLSDQNYFRVFWNDNLTAIYYNSEEEIKAGQVMKIKARDFLGY